MGDDGNDRNDNDLTDTAFLEGRLADLERRVRELEGTPGTAKDRDASEPRDDEAAPETFWALNGLIDQMGPEGGVTYTGQVTPPGQDSPVSWQMGLTASALEDMDFSDAADTLSAVGSGIRLSLLQAIYDGKSTVAELSADDRFGTSGQIYHHINALAGAGWLEKSKRGHWRLRATRIIPLLTLVLIGTH
ncbi:MAG: ArsR/SmtB family transcription factor [Mycobacteriaceae bacterium]|uniref:ArsR/SmtB family transcription factor n=1 Tax=Corynebacterium sp. TaxID=1720 RepID=UPI003F945FDF